MNEVDQGDASLKRARGRRRAREEARAAGVLPLRIGVPEGDGVLRHEPLQGDARSPVHARLVHEQERVATIQLTQPVDDSRFSLSEVSLDSAQGVPGGLREAVECHRRRREEEVRRELAGGHLPLLRQREE